LTDFDDLPADDTDLVDWIGAEGGVTCQQ